MSEILSNECIFKQSIPYYKNSLKKSGYNVSLKYTRMQNQDKNNQQRKRKIIWLNQPYSLNVKTNMGQLFLKLVDHHFPRTHKFHKIFNRDTVIISNCCMKNIGSIISSCNCRKKESFPLGNKCLTPNITYEALITNNTNNEHKKQLSATKTSFLRKDKATTREILNIKCI